ncbi:hypothetical protein O2N63_06920 [Aliiroseovarius sp. KMU-50]|uniref:Protein ImuA n=1 Tax=Aliiroseovarius salicola TaxID=3009082 RepID=A0ABT4VZY2_9RHOB|nr:hypothetical protein [Aliiroseovarius sp. KMU-50]MDA5093817.1 hypothetical protein [Aliiroseovarius sp. KMU-50]
MSTRFADLFPPRRGRTHEVTGAGAHAFAALLAGRLKGDVVWLIEAWRSDTLNPLGIFPFCDPSKLLMVHAPSPTDLLAAMEEALRSGSVALVVAEVSEALSLKAGRRLQLAAEAGRVTGLVIIPEGKGSNAAQTRWRAEPLPPAQTTLSDHRPGPPRWRWSLVKNKAGATPAWDVMWTLSGKEDRHDEYADIHTGKTGHLSVVAASGERAVSAPLPL